MTAVFHEVLEAVETLPPDDQQALLRLSSAGFGNAAEPSWSAPSTIPVPSLRVANVVR